MGSILLGAQNQPPITTAAQNGPRVDNEYCKHQGEGNTKIHQIQFKPLKAVRLQAAVCCICTSGICCLRPRLCFLAPTSFDPNLAPKIIVLDDASHASHLVYPTPPPPKPASLGAHWTPLIVGIEMPPRSGPSCARLIPQSLRTPGIEAPLFLQHISILGPSPLKGRQP